MGFAFKVDLTPDSDPNPSPNSNPNSNLNSNSYPNSNPTPTPTPNPHPAWALRSRWRTLVARARATLPSSRTSSACSGLRRRSSDCMPGGEKEIF